MLYQIYYRFIDTVNQFQQTALGNFQNNVNIQFINQTFYLYSNHLTMQLKTGWTSSLNLSQNRLLRLLHSRIFQNSTTEMKNLSFVRQSWPPTSRPSKNTVRDGHLVITISREFTSVKKAKRNERRYQQVEQKFQKYMKLSQNSIGCQQN